MSDLDESGTARVRDLVVRAHGSTVLVVRRSAADEESAALAGAVPVGPGEGLVLTSPAAVQAGGFRTALRKACRAAVAAAERTRNPAEPPRLWVAVPSLGERGRGRPQGQKLARELGAEVHAPSGPVRIVAGGCAYAGDEDHRWIRFTADGPGEAHGTRFPRPEWEDRLPRGSGYDGTLHLRPVPAGLAAALDGAEPVLELARWIPVAPARPRLVIGGRGLLPHQVAALLRRFPEPVRLRMQLVPLDQWTASGGWLAELSRTLGHEVVSTIGPLQQLGGLEAAHLVDAIGAPTWRPFAAALRHGADGRIAAVQANLAPRGWMPAGPLAYRWSGSPEVQPTPHEIIAKVVPAGLALVPASKVASSTSADRLSFETDRLTITVGVPCTPMPEGAALALHRVLGGLDREQLARVRILVLGVADRAARSALLSAAGELRGRVAFPKVLSAPLREEDATLRVHRQATAPAEAERTQRVERVERTQVVRAADVAAAEKPDALRTGGAPAQAASAPAAEETTVVRAADVAAAAGASTEQEAGTNNGAAPAKSGSTAAAATAAGPSAAGAPPITMSGGPVPTTSAETVRVDVSTLRAAMTAEPEHEATAEAAAPAEPGAATAAEHPPATSGDSTAQAS
ncbi:MULTISPECIES: hypothetical protein [unclassified Saccharopolyspora]|uniref:hypothetical protein n=1 Tax=unclassified Saccharopolyspora TaxID=2646250 RepID=UPI001CD36524|nr:MULTISPECIES: hypothetical protein [unclassified Saccharopolyspora]MCA1185258.1 hypothetical protein [Saccharopolyspora sp. 6T]MCA1225108.1 hypothetical protein [Saccharopolyspora sp. 6M]